MNDEPRTQPPEDPGEPPAWDRVGQFLQDVAAVTGAIAERNKDLWTQVSDRLRADAYPADAMSTDAARAMTTALSNLEDVWTLLTRPPERERVATTLPTAFLVFHYLEGHWSVVDPVWIRPSYWERDELPDRADIYVHGDDAGARAVGECLRADRRDKAYLLGVADVGDLVPGVYTGIVAIGERPLADLRIFVAKPQ
jgi:hypothetical protein